MSETTTGPANPAHEGLDAPTPPGGPQRQDAAATTRQPHEAAPGVPDVGQPSPASDSSNPDSASEPVHEPDTEPDTTSDPQTDPDEEGRQEENAETSLDQPSDG